MYGILIIEDDDAILNLIRSALCGEGYECEVASDGAEGERLFDSRKWDLVLLDLMLPEVSGFDLIEYIKPTGTPIIVISAMNGVGDKVRGLTMGADDYIGKPFQVRELLARVEAVLRRTGAKISSFSYAGVEVNFDKREVSKAGEVIPLTAKEFDMLELFISKKNVVISSQTIYEKVWKEEFMGDTRTVDSHVHSLRKKIGYEDVIHTVFGVGYRMDIVK